MDANVINEKIEQPSNNYLKVGDRFKVLKSKVFTTKTYNRAGLKILCDNGEVVFTTAGNIVKIFAELSEEQITRAPFEVIQVGTYNTYPVLSLKSDSPEIDRRILEVLF